MLDFLFVVFLDFLAVCSSNYEVSAGAVVVSIGSHVQRSLTANITGIYISTFLKQINHNIILPSPAGRHQSSPASLGSAVDLRPVLRQVLDSVLVSSTDRHH